MKFKVLFLTAAIIVASAAATMAQVPSYVPTNGLVGWWPFNGNANDESGKGNNGTVNGATLTTDRNGNSNQAYSFNGTNNLINVVNSPSLQFNGALTISTWINAAFLPVGQTASTSYILSKGADGGTPNSWVYLWDDTNIGMGVYDDAGLTNCGNYSTIQEFPYELNTWYNVISVFDGSTAKMYVNGVLIKTTPCVRTIFSNVYDLKFGRRHFNGLPYFFNGKLDDIGIWNRALTQQEITNLYNASTCTAEILQNDTTICAGQSITLNAKDAGSGVQSCSSNTLPANLQNGLVAYYPFCGNANDASGNGNNGTVNGATLTTDRFGKASSAYSFDGENDWITITKTLLNGGYQSYSFSYWYNKSSATSIEQSVINDRPTGSSGWKYYANFKGDTFGAQVCIASQNSEDQTSCVNLITSEPNLSNGTWRNISFTLNTSTNLAKIYLDGVLESSVQFNPNNWPTNTNSTFIGASPFATGDEQWFKGKLDDIGIWSRVLSDQEIQQMYAVQSTEYLWSTGATTPSISVSPTQTTTYKLTVNQNGVTCTDSVKVTVSNPTASISGTNTICSGRSTTLTATGGGSYLWSTGATTASITVSPTQNTTYTVTVTNAAGCTATASRTVTVTPTPSAPSVSSNSPVTQGGTITLSAAQVSGAAYQWTGPNGFSSTSRTPSIPNATVANGGTYSVNITVNGCTSAAASVNVTVNPVVKTVTLYMDTTSGINGSEVVVRVRARDFNKILSAQGTVNFNATELQFLNTEQYVLPSLAAGNFGTGQTASGRLTFSWNDATLNGATLANGGALFGIRFRILAPGGSFSILSFGNTPTPIEVVDTSFTAINTALIQGRVNVLNQVDISGRIRTETGSGVRSATVAATGTPNFNFLTDTSGKYTFRVTTGSSYEVTPSKNNDTLKANGITGLDVVLIQRHILGTLLLGSPYKIIAADVNNSGSVTTADINLIQALILGNNTSFPNGRLWAFLPSSHSFANPQNPFPFPQSRVYASASNQTNQDFIGMRLGDVNNTYNSFVAKIAADTVTLVLPQRSIPANSDANVTVTAKDFNKVAAMQLTISWDPAVVELLTAGSPGALGASFGLSRKDEGLLSVLWTEPNAQSLTLTDGTELFTLGFRAKAPAGSSTPLTINSAMTPVEVVDSSLNIMGVKVVAGSLNIENSTAVNPVVKDITDIMLAPNPFNQFSTLRFSMSAQRDCVIRITDISGRQIEQRLIKAAVGQNTLEVGQGLIPGTYLLSIETGDEIQTLKMVVVE